MLRPRVPIYLHSGLRLLQRVDGVAHQLRDLGHNFVDFYLELLRLRVGVGSLGVLQVSFSFTSR